MGLGRFLKRKNREDALAKELDQLELPSFPATVTQLLGLLREEEANTKEIARLLERDPGLHLRVLRTVNSAAFGLSSAVDSIARAVTLLGRARLEALVLAVAVKDGLPKDAPGFDGSSFWATAARRAAVARSLAQRFKSPSVAEVFTAALLQDVAIPVLMQAKGAQYSAVYDRWRHDPDVDLSTIEREVFGRDHQEVGVAVAKHWNLPEFLVRAIAAHHDDDSEMEHAVKLVSRIRDHAENDGVKELLRRGVDLGVEIEEMQELVDRAFAEADEFSKGMD